MRPSSPNQFAVGIRNIPLHEHIARKLFLGVLMFFMAGCSGGSVSPEISPRAVADQALAEYDDNKDGALDAKELNECPGLKSAMKTVDKNNDNRLSVDEIEARLTSLRGGAQAVVPVEATLDGSPLSGATVTLVPEKFMGASFKRLSAVTDAAGNGVLNAEGTSEPVVPLGYYRVEVSKKNAKGQETIPAKYNTKTVLGQEIAMDVQGRGSELIVRVPLTSR